MLTGKNVVNSFLYHVENTPLDDGSTLNTKYSGWVTEIRQVTPVETEDVVPSGAFPRFIAGIPNINSRSMFGGNALTDFPIAGIVLCAVYDSTTKTVHPGRSTQQQLNVQYNLWNALVESNDGCFSIRDWGNQVSGVPSQVTGSNGETMYGRIENVSITTIPGTYNLSWSCFLRTLKQL